MLLHLLRMRIETKERGMKTSICSAAITAVVARRAPLFRTSTHRDEKRITLPISSAVEALHVETRGPKN